MLNNLGLSAVKICQSCHISQGSMDAHRNNHASGLLSGAVILPGVWQLHIHLCVHSPYRSELSPRCALFQKVCIS